MYFWYADDSNFKSEKEFKVPDVFLFGGIIIEYSESKRLIQLMKEIKGRYSHLNLPIKYNLKDLRSKYKEFDREAVFKKMLHESAQWRKELFEHSLNINYKIVVAAVANFQTKSNNQKEIKSDLRRYVFSNAMMRVGLELKEIGVNYSQFILDWPADNEPKPFNREFYSAYNEGKTQDGTPYRSGSLKNIGVHDSLLFTNMNHSNCLQFADLVVGSCKDFLECTLAGRPHSIGKDLTETVLCKYRGYPYKIMERGMNISNNNTELRSKVAEILTNTVTAKN